jgi:hypothetical protein
MPLDFASAPTQQFSGDLVPAGTLAWGIFEVIPANINAGQVLKSGKSNPSNRYLEAKVKIADGKHAGRVIFDMIGQAGQEQYVAGGAAAIRHILEVGKGAHPQKNPAGYQIGAGLAPDDERAYLDLNGLKVAIEVDEEPASNGFKAKNRVKRYLSPNPESDTHAAYARLVAGDTEPKVKNPSASAAPSAPGGGWTAPTQAAPAAPAQASNPNAKPGWV